MGGARAVLTWKEYNIVDRIFIDNGLGYLGNTATGVIFPITVVG